MSTAPNAATDTMFAVAHGNNPVRRLRLPGEVPLIAIAGSRGKSTVGCMLDAIARDAGFHTGAWFSSGVFVQGERLDGELGPWQKVLFASRHGELDLVFQEMNAATVVAVGLPAESYPLAIVTTICGNNEACLLAPETRTERRALVNVLTAVRRDGLVVAGVDDFSVAEAIESSSTETALFALRKENPVLERHLASGGYGAWVAEDTIVVGTLEAASSLLPIADIPATLEGRLTFQVQNALGAALAASAIGLPAASIVRALSTYLPQPDVQPASCNIIPYNGARIVVDAPSQIWSLRMLLRGIRNLPRRRTMVVSGVFPSLPVEDVAEAGRLLGTLGAFVVLHADDEAGERLEALRSGLAASPVPPLVVVVDGEVKAIDTMLNKIGSDDVALVLATDTANALAHLWPAPAISIHPPARLNGAS